MEIKKKNGNIMFFAFVFPLLILSTIFSPALAKDKAAVRLTVDPKTVEVGERFVVNIEVTGEEMSAVGEPEPPQLKGALFLGTATSQRLNSFTATNDQGELEFKAVQTQIYSFTYQATLPGPIVVPSQKVKVGDGQFSTAPANIAVFKQGAGGRRPPNTDQDIEDAFSGDPFEDMHKMEDRFNQLLQRRFGGGGSGGFQAVPNVNEKDTFFIVAEVDKTTVYKGEQITAAWYLYTRAGVREIDTLKYPDLKGFWKEDIELATLLNFQPAQLNNIPYNRALLASYALFPIDDGKATVDAYRAKVTVVGGFGQSATVTKDSEIIPILVKPLPKTAQTAAFSGAVGEFQMKAEMDGGPFVANQPFTVRVHVDGRGNAKQFELPGLNLPPDVEVYDIKKDSKFFKTGMSFKEFEITLIPRKEGELIVPPIKTTVFNPRTEKYEEISTAELRVNVLPGSGQQGLASSRLGGPQGDTPAAEEKLNLITQWKPQNVKVELHSGIWAGLFTASGFSILLFAVLQLGVFRKPPVFKDFFATRLKKVDKLIAQEKWRDVGVEATNLSYFVLGDISGQGGANLHVEKLLEKSPPSVRREIGDELKKVMDKFYLMGFGPDLAVESAVKDGSVRDDIKRLEKLLWKAIELSHADIPK